MADLNKVYRSKQRLIEILHHLTGKDAKDEATNKAIDDLQNSIRILDDKLEEFMRQKAA